MSNGWKTIELLQGAGKSIGSGLRQVMLDAQAKAKQEAVARADQDKIAAQRQRDKNTAEYRDARLEIDAKRLTTEKKRETRRAQDSKNRGERENKRLTLQELRQNYLNNKGQRDEARRSAQDIAKRIDDEIANAEADFREAYNSKNTSDEHKARVRQLQERAAKIKADAMRRAIERGMDKETAKKYYEQPEKPLGGVASVAKQVSSAVNAQLPSTSAPASGGQPAPTTGSWKPSPNVEQWRPLVQKYFQPQDVDKALYVLERESRGDPRAANPNSSARGLFQHLEKLWPGRTQQWGMENADIYDPETNIKGAANLLYGPGGGWQHWEAVANYDRDAQGGAKFTGFRPGLPHDFSARPGSPAPSQPPQQPAGPPQQVHTKDGQSYDVSVLMKWIKSEDPTVVTELLKRMFTPDVANQLWNTAQGG